MVVTKLIHTVGGVLLCVSPCSFHRFIHHICSRWEFVSTLGYEYNILRRRQNYKRTIWVGCIFSFPDYPHVRMMHFRSIPDAVLVPLLHFASCSQNKTGGWLTIARSVISPVSIDLMLICENEGNFSCLFGVCIPVVGTRLHNHHSSNVRVSPQVSVLLLNEMKSTDTRYGIKVNTTGRSSPCRAPSSQRVPHSIFTVSYFRIPYNPPKPSEQICLWYVVMWPLLDNIY